MLVFLPSLWLATAITLRAIPIFAATPPYDGTLARYYKVPADLAYVLPDHLSLEDGAMVRFSGLS